MDGCPDNSAGFMSIERSAAYTAPRADDERKRLNRSSAFEPHPSQRAIFRSPLNKCGIAMP